MKAIVLGLLLFVGCAEAKVFQFLYIEASEGNASGGHVAVQLGDDVYHYQYEDAMIRLFKHNAESFRVNYQLLQNRTIHIAEIDVSEAAYEQISRYFKIRYLRQKQHLKNLKALQHDQFLLQALLDLKQGRAANLQVEPGQSPKLTGAGLFYDDGDLPITENISQCDADQASLNMLTMVQQKLVDHYGKNFLSEKIAALNNKLRKLSPDVMGDTSSPHYSFSEHYSDLLNGLLALQALQKYRPLTKNACFQIKHAGRLDDSEIRQAKALQQDLIRSASSLITSKRPDWGSALFVTLARLVVLEHAIQTRYWAFLDDTEENATPIPGNQLALYKKNIQNQRNVDLMRFQGAVKGFTEGNQTYEFKYSNLEIAANRFQQWLVSENTGELRYRSEQPLPGKSIPSTRFLFTDLSAKQLETFQHSHALTFLRLNKEDKEHNAYHLLVKNCVTTLFESINESVSGHSHAMLGGFIEPKYTFIPFQAFDSVQDTYKVVKTSELPAYRQQELTKMYNREVDSWVYARESNLFSSSLYTHNPDDAWFVFFTDDTVLLRPLFGAVNVLAASSQSVYGLLSSPFDEGREIKIGFRGVLASLPELVFFNIRKGSYPYPIQH